MIDRAFWRDRRVLVTGHTGFKGSWLTMWLAASGAEVVGLALRPEGRSLFDDARVDADCRSHFVDVRDAAAVRAVVREADAEIVFHLAAQSLVRASYAAAAETWAVNVDGTIHLLDALRDATRTKAIVVVTSDKCYEHVGPSHPFVETDPLGGHDPYSASKAAAEIAAASWRRSFFEASGIGVATARAGNVIGGGDWASDRLVPDLVRSCTAREPVAIRSPRARRPWQHVLEPLRGYLMLAERLAARPERFGGAWNFGPADRESMQVATFVEDIDRAMDGRPNWNVVEDATLHEASALALSSDKAHRELGWTSVLSVGAAIELTAAAYLVALRDGDQRAFARDQIAAYEQRATAHATNPAAASRPTARSDAAFAS